MEKSVVVEKKIRRASFLLATGLLVQLLSLLQIHPLAFVAFAAIGCPLAASGILLYLLAILRSG